MSRLSNTIVMICIDLLLVNASALQLAASPQLEPQEVLEKSQQAIDQLIQATSEFRKVRFEFSTSHGVVPMELSKRDNEAILIQLPTSKDSTERYKRPILGVNNAYNFELTRNGSGLTIASLRLNSNEPATMQRYLHTWSNIYSKGFLTLPEFIPYADIDLTESGWGLSSVSPILGKQGCYSISFNPKMQNQLSSEGVPLKYGQIKSGSITLDPSKKYLPIDATIQYEQVDESGNLQSWRVEMKWDYIESSNSQFLVSGTEMRYFGDHFEDFEPNREWNYQNNISNVTWHKEIARDEFLISRFGFAEPPTPNSGGSSFWVWLILAGVVVVILAFGLSVLSKSKPYA